MKQQLPERASLEFLKKRAKERLAELRRTDPRTRLADAQWALAKELGFSSWRALKQAVEQRRERLTAPFFAACDAGDLETIERLLRDDPSLAHERRAPNARTALHRAAIAQRLDVVRLLLANGADPNTREAGDQAYPHHFAAELGALEIVRACLDAGGDVDGVGDGHESGVIGWALCLPAQPRLDVAELLLARGARHHIFSAIAARDLGVIQDLVEEQEAALYRRRSRFEQRETPLHFAARRATPDVVELLIRLGADLEAQDDVGRTPLARALLAKRDDNARALRDAGAKEPAQSPQSSFDAVTPILQVKNFAEATAYYQQQLGFEKSWEWGEPPEFGCVLRGKVRLFLGENLGFGASGVFFDVEDVDGLYGEYQQRGATIRHAPKNEPWGTREMVVEDPDGNVLRLASA